MSKSHTLAITTEPGSGTAPWALWPITSTVGLWIKQFTDTINVHLILLKSILITKHEQDD